LYAPPLFEELFMNVVLLGGAGEFIAEEGALFIPPYTLIVAGFSIIALSRSKFAASLALA
jgi:hypothetical protein